ncbi:uncharacterized protein LOC131317959 isoform X1 [Rhododendron vialii]|uniref:uncharacterized protein LOC131317959 isoform X1 n=1 Tax=Rhododendron vialii TaxID=182163 RepID=UPI00265FEAE0|nr:uncharacterized protein LOC131317959 isoform X1 [Rhododendron vialii]XP_058203675.1 uncharacterized protein LOC131317959 isoform X1 [Rhododendron vialii]XP_058203676.1 uncharacterized protein LOC131317959 isoform X1 [Rhododendron vialii]XP_058203677.1 uncharacterized protein LOC131317959 isoform X1 [Rhododendron vialii]XP_058203678.1 uncharacterized protein LOC131317959 isoform X1 [Rhododendron vialii]XP_058203679.1 uncharacterized protein LOC131317959 isoform X1 [Rhododendron vialii]XP_05
MLSKSRFSWNPVKKTVECSDEVWATYVAANPDAKHLRGKKIEMLNELAIMCGNDQVCSAKDLNANYSRKTNISDDEYSPISDFNDNVVVEDLCDISTGGGNGFPTQQGNTSSQIPMLGKPSRGPAKPLKYRSTKPKGTELMSETMASVVTNMARLADAYEKSLPCIDYNEIYKALVDVDDIDINSRMNAFYFLSNRMQIL